MDKDNGPPRSELIASEKICTMIKGQSHSQGTAQSTGREDASDQYTTANGHLVENKAAVELFKVKAESKVVYQNTEIGQCRMREKAMLVEMSKRTCMFEINSLNKDIVKHPTRKARKVKSVDKLKGNKRRRHSALVDFKGESDKKPLHCTYCLYNTTISKKLKRHLKRQHCFDKRNAGRRKAALEPEAQCEGTKCDPKDLQGVLQVSTCIYKSRYDYGE